MHYAGSRSAGCRCHLGSEMDSEIKTKNLNILLFSLSLPSLPSVLLDSVIYLNRESSEVHIGSVNHLKLTNTPSGSRNKG
jgi:hypothetical protein